MRKSLTILLLLIIPALASAQTITLGPIAKTAFCINDTVRISYHATGSFGPTNQFRYNLSDANGSFASFTNLGQAFGSVDSIAVYLPATGNHYRIRIISTNPYVISDTSQSFQVTSYPAPLPSSTRNYTNAGFVGDPIKFIDGHQEPIGSVVSWRFDQDALPDTSTLLSPIVIYSKDGWKNASLTVTSPAGCSSTAACHFRVFSCYPIIPKSVHIVTGTESGSDSAIWVMPGGSYTENNANNNVIYAESGASIRAEFRSNAVYYLKHGVSFISSNGQGFATVISTEPDKITWDPYNDVDTLSCQNLDFDTSLQRLTQRMTVDEPLIVPDVRVQGSTLIVKDCGTIIFVRLFNTLGIEICGLAKYGPINLDLTPLPAGVYFAEVSSNGKTTVQKIVR